MKLRPLILVIVLFFANVAAAQVQLEKPNEPAPAPGAADQTTAPADSTPAPAPAPAPAPMPMPMPMAPEPPQSQNPIGLLILAVILAHVCLPLGVIVGIILLLIIFRLFRGGLMKLLMGLAATGGAARAVKGVLFIIGGLIVLPSGLLGLNWASRWMDYRISGATYWIYGLVVAVVTGLVFFTVVKAIANAVKKKMMGRMGGMAGMMGGMGGMGGFPGFPGMGDPRELKGKKGGKKRR